MTGPTLAEAIEAFTRHAREMQANTARDRFAEWLSSPEVAEGMAKVLGLHREDPAYPDTCLCEASISEDDEVDGHYSRHASSVLLAWLAEEVRS